MNEIKSTKIISQALNTPIWQVKKGIGSFLTFDLGEKIEKKKRDATVFFSGSIHLWIYMCDWKILKKGKVVTQSSADEKEILESLYFFENRFIISISRINENEIHFQFSQDATLVLNGNDAIYEKDCDFFILYTPIGNISYNKKFGFVVE